MKISLTTGVLIGAGIAGIALRLRSSTDASPLLPKAMSKTLTINGRQVYVHVPANLGRLRTVIYFHGHGQSINDVVSTIVPSLDMARSPAILVVPQLGSSSEPGNLADAGAIDALLRAIDAPLDQVDILAHSGGYVAAANAIDRGGVQISSVGLLDALYGQLSSFSAFVTKSSTRHLANVYGPSTSELSHTLGKLEPSGEIDTPSSTPSVPFMATHKLSTIATSIFHPDVPKVYGAAMVDAFS